MARTIINTVGPLASASATNIYGPTTPGAGTLTLAGALVTGTVATPDKPRRILITTAANESSKTFTIVGVDANNSVVTELITGPNATTAQSALDYKSVTSVSISAAATGNVSIGTSTVASSGWVRLDEMSFAQGGVQFTATGTVNYTFQTTFDDPNDPISPVLPYLVTWDTSMTSVVNATGTTSVVLIGVPRFVKTTINSGTGSVVTTIQQYASAPL